MKILMMILLILLVSAVVLAVLYLLAVMPRMTNRADIRPFLGRLYAHRGLHDNASDAPENSLAAFRKAVEKGFGIELDVQLTKDLVPVVFHDFTLKRVCGVDKKVRELTFDQLQELRLCGSDQRIPSFDQVLRLVKGRVPLIIEYKIEALDTRVCELGTGCSRIIPEHTAWNPSIRWEYGGISVIGRRFFGGFSRITM